ncbi:MAG TPA: hypothetical protein VFL99_09085 [Segeticoccus sp.]|uniref:hypothetical protein n=1 Tax=Segeticoccus sp. TaxID=2706531 RepID=UPI002D7F23E4|nr:hypothetical protein [Segeticoccus sp.]HET8600467.1 hypothetical protein [Segeticoccus sp.]
MAAHERVPSAPLGEVGPSRLARNPWPYRLKAVANVLNLSTPFGLTVAALGRARLRPGPRGLVLGEHYRPAFPIATAFTVGNVVLTGSDWASLLARNPELLQHEERHSWQWMVCLGLPFLPLYVAAMGWSVLRTGDRASANVFEVDAGLERGGYRPPPTT